jgi:hypothetical protein
VSATRAVTPAALSVLAALAVVYAYFVDGTAVSDADRAARRGELFPSFRVEDVSRIELSHGAETLVLERDIDSGDGALWTMTSPLRERADAAVVDVLLRDLERAARVRPVDPRNASGLDAPRARGLVKVGKLSYTFELGGDAPSPEGGAYVRVDGEGTFVVARPLKVQLLRGADSYRDRSIVPYGASGVGRLEVQRASGERLVLERHGATFRITPSGLRAARAEVDQLLLALADARADVFLDPDAAERATAQPAFRVVVEPREGTKAAPVDLRVGPACPDQPDDVVLVRTSPRRLAACVPKSFAAALAATGSSFVDTAPLFARADEIEELRLERLGPGRGLVVDVARRGSGWHERAPEDRELGPRESASVSSLALELAQARIPSDGVRRAAEGEHLDPRSRVTVARTGGGATEVIEVAAPAEDGTALARRLDDGALLRLPRAERRHFEPHPVVTRDRSPWRAPFDAGAVVAVEDTCGPSPERLELVGGTWTMSGHGGLGLDSASLVQESAGLAHLEAEAWIAEADDGTFGFQGPGACTVTLSLYAGAADAAPRHVGVIFGAAGEGGFYARTLEDPAVFVAPIALRQALSHPAIDASRLRVDPAEQDVTVVHDGARRVLEPPASAGDRLATALGALRVRVALHGGPPPRAEGFERPALEILANGRTDGGAAARVRIAIGASTQVDGVDAYFARVSGVDATFAVPAGAVAAILDAF